jgi:hypothetical protein
VFDADAAYVQRLFVDAESKGDRDVEICSRPLILEFKPLPHAMNVPLAEACRICRKPIQFGENMALKRRVG